MTVPSDFPPDGWTPGAEDPEEPPAPARSSAASATLPGADEADLAEQSLEVPWEDDELR